jgi:hypothetical protein
VPVLDLLVELHQAQDGQVEAHTICLRRLEA